MKHDLYDILTADNVDQKRHENISSWNNLFSIDIS